jgi:hypothetical protein
MKNISATSISTFESCPLRWKYRYIYKLYSLPSAALSIGSDYHKCLENYSKYTSYDFIILTSKHGKLLDTMVSKYIENPVSGNMQETEYRFSLDLPGLPVPVIGFIDRIDEDKGVEYKTSSYDYQPEHTETIQSKLYSYVLRQRFGRVVPIVYSVMNKKKAHQKKYIPQTLPIVYEDGVLDSLPEEINKTYKDITQSDFPPKPDIHCYWCSWGRKTGDGTCRFSK